MKPLIALFLAGVSSMSMAAESVSNQQGQPTVEQYTYSSHPDIAKVVSQDEIPDVCGPVQIKMTYEDHQGLLHTMEYQVMGNGCSNG